jgi:hypothetical protein
MEVFFTLALLSMRKGGGEGFTSVSWESIVWALMMGTSSTTSVKVAVRELHSQLVRVIKA